ncbi:macrophage-expressed gene 1 protein-like [Saccostrea echinata]|uniref:macrophage-expressed gene 1 protein-like n=1 Tax=Saccostrea echinata TaxID=191078 RepID=UPI002A7FCD03|nr:macrophage-expressed gene 1 protein-like [Saccostrea echinata]
MAIGRFYLLWTFFCALTIGAELEGKPKPPSPPPVNPFTPGDVKWCAWKMGGNVARFEVLPGLGWDNLQNKDAGMLVQYNYSECRTTEDGRYLIPDCVFTVPIKSSQLEVFGELFQHWNNYTATTSSSVNVEAGLHLGSFGISGKYSHESQSVRKHQIMDKSVTTRVQARYIRYSAKLQPDTPLNPAFRKRLKNIAYYIQTNKTNMARYQSQLLVRDYGTHVISSVDAGAIISQLDEVKSTFSNSYSMDSRQVVAAASASFMSIFSVGAEYKHSTSQEVIDQYLGNRTHSKVKTFGGPVFQPSNFTLNQWAAEIGLDLVSVDRSGFPIYDLISTQTLPELPPSILYPLVQTVKGAVEEYYKFNVYRGCTNIDSPNFSFIANVDDGTCESPETNYTFGGVYQTCSQSGQLRQNLCTGLTQKNPLTGGYSCQSGYESILLTEGKRSGSESRRSCHSCGFLGWSTCCDNYMVYGQAKYQAYWCVAQGHVDKQSGFQFGGIYTTSIDNPLTQSHGCPLYFYPLKLGLDMKVCVSDDYELGFRYSVPFAGLFSCMTGNPLFIHQETTSKNPEMLHSLFSYLKSSSPNSWPRGCPKGYSMHLATVENSCEIDYCVKAHAFANKGLPPVRRPPFMELPGDAYVDSGVTEEYMISVGGETWTDLAVDPSYSDKENKPNSDSQTNNEAEVSSGTTAGIVIGVTLVVIVTIAVVTLMFKRHRRSKRPYQRMDNPSANFVNRREYGTAGQSTEPPQTA